MAKHTPRPAAAPEQRFAGTYDPPALGADVSPIRIAGPGHLTLTATEVIASGFEPKGNGLRALGFLAAVLVSAGTLTWVRVTWFPDLSTIVVGVIAGIIGLGLFRVFMTGAAHDPRAPIEQRYPISGLTDARADIRDGDSLVLRLDYAKVRGTLHFKPTGSPEPLRGALQRAGVRVRAR